MLHQNENEEKFVPNESGDKLNFNKTSSDDWSELI
jgi:hypothetical protein